MRRIAPSLSGALLVGTLVAAPGGEGDDVKNPSFEAPVRLMAGGAPVSSEAPGYASPAWYDVNGDGRADLVVGQFAGGKMRAYHGQPDGSLAEGQWIQAGGEVAQVPGVW